MLMASGHYRGMISSIVQLEVSCGFGLNLQHGERHTRLGQQGSQVLRVTNPLLKDPALESQGLHRL